MAVQMDHVACAERLIRMTGVKHYCTQGGFRRYVIKEAAARGRERCLRILLSDPGANLKGTDDPYACTALCVAAYNGQTACVHMIINDKRFDASFYGQQDRRCTPMHHAAVRGHIGCIRVMMPKLRSLVSFVDDSGFTPLTCAAKYGRLECFIALLRERAGDNSKDARRSRRLALFVAAQHRRRLFVRHLLMSPDSVDDYTDAVGDTALIHLISARDEENVELLMRSKRFNVNAIGYKGRTALMEAVRSANPRILSMLLRVPGIEAENTRFGDMDALGVSLLLPHPDIAKMLTSVVSDMRVVCMALSLAHEYPWWTMFVDEAVRRCRWDHMVLNRTGAALSRPPSYPPSRRPSYPPSCPPSRSSVVYALILASRRGYGSARLMRQWFHEDTPPTAIDVPVSPLGAHTTGNGLCVWMFGVRICSSVLGWARWILPW